MSSTISTPEPPGAWPSAGTMLASRYEVLEVIGRGGSSVIYRARELALGRNVALKVLDLRSDSSEEIDQRKKRFYQEARLMAQLRAPSTVMMHDYGRTADGLLFLVFEYIDGTTLEQALESGPIDAPRTRGILVQVLESLREAHALGFLHRDIKPSNIMLYKRLGQPDGVKVLDFGIAKPLETGNLAEITNAGHVVGTPQYLAPERIRGKPVGPASDLFSLGVTAYAMLVGSTPFAHLRDVSLMTALMTEQVKLPDAVRVDAELRGAIDAMLEIEPHRRPQSVDELLATLGIELEPVADGRPARQDVVAFPLDLDPLGGTPIDELTGTTNVQSMTLTTTNMSVAAFPVDAHDDALDETAVRTPGRAEALATGEDSSSGSVVPNWVWFSLGALAVIAGVAFAVFGGESTPSSPNQAPSATVVAVDRAAADVSRAIGFAGIAAEIEQNSRTPEPSLELERPRIAPRPERSQSEERPPKKQVPRPEPWREKKEVRKQEPQRLEVQPIDEIAP